jgi:hypothetical protein
MWGLTDRTISFKMQDMAAMHTHALHATLILITLHANLTRTDGWLKCDVCGMRKCEKL